jgi:purine-binding chemotaxis protein CheW
MNPSTATSTSPHAAAVRAGHADASARSSEFLAFRLGAEEYGIDILRVQEIRSFEPPTRIAGAPAHLLGVTNLRGAIVPVADLRVKFGCEKAEFGPFTVVIVLNIGQRVVGAVVDAVSDVLRLADDQIRPAPELATDGASCITGIGNLTTDGRERMLILLDIQALMQRADMGL